jgi:hypothetical protein
MGAFVSLDINIYADVPKRLDRILLPIYGRTVFTGDIYKSTV